MTTKSRPWRAAALAAAALIAGCTTGTGPGPIESEYALATVGSAALPHRVGNETWIADTIRFHPADAWSRVEVVTLHGEGTTPDPVRRTSEGFVTRLGGRLVLDFDCNDVILRSCVAPDTVRVVITGLERLPNRYGSDDLGSPLFHYRPVTR